MVNGYGVFLEELRNKLVLLYVSQVFGDGSVGPLTFFFALILVFRLRVSPLVVGGNVVLFIREQRLFFLQFDVWLIFGTIRSQLVVIYVFD